MTHRTRLQIPQGTEAFYIEEALAHRALQRTVEDTCALWGYLPVQTPVFDYYDLFHPLLSTESRSRIYRLFDRDGDVLMLRSDVTLFLARQVGLAATPDDFPLRVQYGDSILRHEHPLEISTNEFFQMGAELVGLEGPEADAEILLLHLDALSALGVANARCHIGSRALLPHGSQGDDAQQLREAIRLRDRSSLTAALVDLGASEGQAAALGEFLSFIGSPTAFADALDANRALLAGLPPEIAPVDATAADHLLEVAELVCESHDDAAEVEIDLSEVGTQPYHSGIVFQTYLPDLPAPVASGGRYDDLIAHFGTPASSVGFSMMTRLVQQAVAAKKPRSAPASGGSFAERLADARTRRRNGEVVTL